MEFFNKKEEVIDLKLTQFGRYLLSKGKLKPVFYSFFDDNIVYNGSKAGVVELQNDAEKRIRETPTMHHQISVSSLEKEFNNNYNKILSGETTATAKDVQRTAEKHYALPPALGTSDVNSNSAPAWSVQLLNGEITGSVTNLSLTEKSGGKNTQLIPQINSELEIDMIDISGANTDEEEFEEGLAGANVVISSEDNELYILLKVAENNGLFQKKNFDIELFEIEEEVQVGGTIETLKQLSFPTAQEAATEVSFLDEVTPDEDVTSVEYYFDLLVDDEIDDEILCEFDPVNEKMGVFSDPRTKLCQDVINKQKKKVFDIYEDEEDYPGEIC